MPIATAPHASISPDDATPGRPSWLLISSVDGALLGDDESLAALVSALAGTDRLLVALNSSRSIAGVRSIVDARLGGWQPDGIIGAFGTEIEWNGVRLANWDRRFVTWDRQLVQRTAAACDLTPVDPDLDTDYKVGYAAAASEAEEMLTALEAAGVAVTVVAAGENRLDVIPAEAGKGKAARFVASLLGIPPGRIVTAGGFERDLDLLYTGKGIVVANGDTALRGGLAGRGAYFASADSAGGVLEGLQHFGAPI